jgi:hypothetical protein
MAPAEAEPIVYWAGKHVEACIPVQPSEEVSQADAPALVQYLPGRIIGEPREEDVNGPMLLRLRSNCVGLRTVIPTTGSAPLLWNAPEAFRER